MTNKYQNNMSRPSSRPGLAVPDAVTIAMGKSNKDLRESLLALAVGGRPAGDGRPDGGRRGRGVRAPRETRPRADRGAPGA